ncbi:hypothetical protein COT65_02020 [Candidatus Shapirobacteria bacterium CG09_land_8_20_14_0_10_47_13]|uniref:DUF5666 domain-containing protein n=1 Tax=Candidatus Shapirobacteria bacterium CG09_land_8_20_14_0_10_47_13 TaxID=1974481 RepID=A0A2H0WMH2_9BACT|nr:MAG: hypothetical protein COT65_02020 [Candidatus Shapirobacteria bacterium CG09_land_8_20_14_0_10_47_13]
MLVIGYWLSVSPILAAVATPSATPSEGNPSVVQELRDKVKEIVRQQIDEIKKGQKRAYFGEISQITDSLITVSVSADKEKQIKISAETKIINLAKKDIKVTDLKISDFIIAMGNLGDEEVLEAKRIVVAARPKALSRRVAVGKVTDISTEERILTVKNDKKDLTYTITIAGNAVITKKVGTKIQKVTFDKIEKGDRLVAIGTLKENGEKILTAKLIHIIPGQTNTPTASPSPSPKPTASPKSSPTPQ